MSGLKISIFFGIPVVLITAVITHFVIGDFTEATVFVGVLAGILPQLHLAQTQGEREQVDD